MITIRNNEFKIVMWIQGRPETKVEHDVVQYYYERLGLLVLGFIAMVVCFCVYGLMSCRIRTCDYRFVIKTKNVPQSTQIAFYRDSSIIILLVCFLLSFTSPILLLAPKYSLTGEIHMLWHVLEAFYALLPIAGIVMDISFGCFLLEKLSQKEDDKVPLAEIISNL